MRPILVPAFRSLTRGLRPASRTFATSPRLSHVPLAHPQDVPPEEDALSINLGPRKPRMPQPIPRLEILKRRIGIAYPSGRELDLSFITLRDMCKCPKCVDPHSKQRSFRTQDIPDKITSRSVAFDGKTLEISWTNDIPGYGEDHLSRFSMEVLKQKVVNPHNKSVPQSRPLPWDRYDMDNVQHWVSYEDYMNDDEKFAGAMQNLSRLGLIFVKDIPQSREMVENIATRMGPLRNSFYGPTWDVRNVPQAKNVAYTNQFLGFHMDLLYMNEPPGYQLLHCLENSCEGGESLFVDTFRIASIMSQKHPEQYATLTKRRLAYEYRHEHAVYYNQWPVIELAPDRTNVAHVNYSPPFQSSLPQTRLSSPVDTSGWKDQIQLKHALKTFSDLMERKNAIFELKLNPGECVIFANRRIAHARRQFNTSSGSRWLAGAYVDEDAVLSQIHVSRSKYPAGSAAADPWKIVHKKEEYDAWVEQQRADVLSQTQKQAAEGQAEKQHVEKEVDEQEGEQVEAKKE